VEISARRLVIIWTKQSKINIVTRNKGMVENKNKERAEKRNYLT
jgi:hypothetical protein